MGVQSIGAGGPNDLMTADVPHLRAALTPRQACNKSVASEADLQAIRPQARIEKFGIDDLAQELITERNLDNEADAPRGSSQDHLCRRMKTIKRQGEREPTSTERREDLLVLKDLIEAGTVTPVVSRTFPLAEAGDPSPMPTKATDWARQSSPCDGTTAPRDVRRARQRSGRERTGLDWKGADTARGVDDRWYRKSTLGTRIPSDHDLRLTLLPTGRRVVVAALSGTRLNAPSSSCALCSCSTA